MFVSVLTGLSLLACTGAASDDSAGADSGLVVDTRPDRDGDGVPDEDDCDPDDPWTYPGANEIPYDGKDNDCANDGDLTDVDDDGFDGVGVEWGDDCNDNNPTIYPGAVEVCYNGIDENCDGLEDTNDCDGDGYDGRGDNTTDCDDEDPDINPGMAETWYDGIDGDCSGHIDSDYDQDGDGFEHPSSPDGGDDCDDEDALTYPGNKETWDGVDNDCDGVADGLNSRDADLTWSGDWYFDGDGFLGLGGAIVGDVNGDGVAEIAIGGLGSSDAGYPGRVYLFDPMAADGGFKDTALGQSDGNAEYYGVDIDALGDLNGDGDLDLLIGAPLANFGSTIGGAYLISASAIMAGQGSSAAWGQISAADDYSGGDVANLGDWNGDGLPEIGIGSGFWTYAGITIYASGAIKSGGTVTTGIMMAHISDSSGVVGGQSVGGLDYDADGIGDLLFSSDTQPPDDKASWDGNGRVSPFSGADLMGARGANYRVGDTIGLTGGDGEAAGQVNGWLPDVDGDGYDEIVVSLYGHHGDESLGMYQTGAVAVIDGHTYMALESDQEATSVADYLVYGVEDLGHLRSAAEAGDFDGDGVGDMVVISVGDLEYGGLNSRTYIHHGPDVAAGGTVMADESVIEFTSIDQDDLMGWNTLVYDLDGNGLDDLIQTAPYGTGGAGSAVVYYNLLDRFE
jgi:hypothetical protein